MPLCSDFLSVFKGEPHILLAMNGHILPRVPVLLQIQDTTGNDGKTGAQDWTLTLSQD